MRNSRISGAAFTNSGRYIGAVAGLPTEPSGRPEVSRVAGDLRSAVSAGSETRAELATIARSVLAFVVAMGVGIAAGPDGHADEPPTSGRASTAKTEHFDHDPGWEGRNNRIISKE